MSRLTEKNAIIFSGRMCGKTLFTNIYKKLGKLEDLADDLGCPLENIIYLLLAYKQGYVYTKDFEGKIIREKIISQIGLTTDDEWCVVTSNTFVMTKNYGTTWWLNEREVKESGK